MSATFDAPLETDEAAVDRAARDNSDLPRTFVAEALQGLAEVRAGQTVPFVGHNSDFALWAEAQAAKLRDRRVTELDRDSIAEELETLARAFVDCQLRWAPGGHRN
ncbi:MULTISPECIES: DUF29 family protein [Paraburkholderia]|nr:MULTISPECIES: DUF29 family protein [Paraburkholderia]